jgi:hypothetical protein
LIGFKHAKSFKASLKSTHLFLKETLSVVPDPLFRLDEKFDFLVERDSIFVLNATSLEAIAEVEDYIARKYKVRAKALAKTVADIDWDHVAVYADRRPRAQRLIIALSKRDDIQALNPRIFRRMLNDCGASYTVKNGVFCPAPKSEIKFLETLEGRRWLHDISGKHPYRYRATNRSVDQG